MRWVGVRRARQVEHGKSIRNDRLIAVGETPVNPSPVRGLRHLRSREVDDIAHFFETYNAAQGREFRIIGQGDRRAAQATLEMAIRAARRPKDS